MEIGVLLALIAAFVGPLLGYLAAAKKLSGRIETSEANSLWEESRAIRKDLIERNEYLRAVIDKCDEKIELLTKRIDSLEERNAQLHLENGELKKEVERLRAENIRLKARITELERLNGQA